MGQSGEPVDGVDLVDEPLVGNAGGIRPEEAELKVFAGVKGLVWAVEEIALPVGILLFEEGNDVGTAPAAGLIYVPGHFDHDNVAESAGLDIFGGLLVAGRGAALGSHLDDLAGIFDSGAEEARVGHGVRGGLLDISVAASIHGFSAVLGMLEIGSGDENGIDVVAGV
jgi:hypothetical protein